MGLTGNYRLCRGLWGKAVLQVEEEASFSWPRSGRVTRRWRDATAMDLADPTMRSLIDMGDGLWLRRSNPMSLRCDEKAHRSDCGAGSGLSSGTGACSGGPT